MLFDLPPDRAIAVLFRAMQFPCLSSHSVSTPLPRVGLFRSAMPLLCIESLRSATPLRFRDK
jgi:hypothetical protein